MGLDQEPELTERINTKEDSRNAPHRDRRNVGKTVGIRLTLKPRTLMYEIGDRVVSVNSSYI